MQVFKRNKRAAARATSDTVDKEAAKHLRKDSNDTSYLARAYNKTKSHIKLNFSKYIETLYRNPHAEVVDPATSLQPTEYLPLIDLEVTRPFHTEFEPKYRASDVVSEAASPSLVQLPSAAIDCCPTRCHSAFSSSPRGLSSSSVDHTCQVSPAPLSVSSNSTIPAVAAFSDLSDPADSSSLISSPVSLSLKNFASEDFSVDSKTARALSPASQPTSTTSNDPATQTRSIARIESSNSNRLASKTPVPIAKDSVVTSPIGAPSSTVSSHSYQASASSLSPPTAPSSATSVEDQNSVMGEDSVSPGNGKPTALAPISKNMIDSEHPGLSESSESSSSMGFRKTLRKMAWKVFPKLGPSKPGVQLEIVDEGTERALAETSHSTHDDNGRAQWKKIEAIPTQTFEKLLMHVLPEERQKTTVKVSGTTEGGYHYVVFVDSIVENGDMERFVIKIPAHGTPQRWRAEDEYMLRQEAETMKYVHNKTTIPTPEIIAYSPIIDDTWGFPYIIMSRLPGTWAFDIWFEEDFDFDKKHQVHDTASPEIEQKRINFLRSLAHEMTKLKDIPFNGIGMPFVGDIGGIAQAVDAPLAVSQKYLWSSASDPRHVEERPTYLSTHAYTAAGLNDWEPELTYDANGQFDKDTLESIGMRKVFDAVFAHPVFQSTAEDTFYLQHNDLDMQNILVDEQGFVTGIIDWDGSIAVPRSVAHASVPAFLRRDWFPDNTKSFRHLIFETEHYRQIYAAAMVEAGNPDAMFTTKSGIYQAALASIYEGGRKYDFCDKLLRRIPVLGKDTDNVLEILASGNGWKLQGTLEYWLDIILKPQLPQITMQDVLADLHARFWMTEWESFFETDSDDESTNATKDDSHAELRFGV